VLVVLVRGIQEQKQRAALMAAISRETWTSQSSPNGQPNGKADHQLASRTRAEVRDLQLHDRIVRAGGGVAAHAKAQQ